MADTDLPVLDERDADRMCMAMARDDFLFFILRAYQELHGQALEPNWHIMAIAHWMEKVRAGSVKRLNIAMPPR